MHHATTTAEPTTADDDLIEQLVTAERERKAAEAQAKREADERDARATCEQKVAALRAVIDGWLFDHLQDALAVTYHTPAYAADPPRAILTYHGAQWSIEPYYNDFLLKNPRGHHACNLKPNETAQIVQRNIWAAFAEYDALESRLAREADKQAELDAQRQAQQEADIAAARAEHEACAAEVESARAVANAGVWRWPEGRAITLYRWQWQQGRDEDGTPVYGHGWSHPTMTLDPLHLQATRHHEARRVHLIEESHLPIAEEHTFSGTADLPEELTTAAEVTLPGMNHGFVRELDHYGYWRATQSGMSVTVEADPEPMAWIRELVDHLDDIPF